MAALITAIYPISVSWARQQAHAQPGKTFVEPDGRASGSRLRFMSMND